MRNILFSFSIVIAAILSISNHALATDTGRVDSGAGGNIQTTYEVSIPKNAPSIISDYGHDGTGSHAGEGSLKNIYISNPPGHLVVAAADGEVIAVYKSSVRIEHTSPPGLITGYAPLGEIFVKAGDSVKRGQPIAKTGIGRSSDHFWQHKLTFYVSLNEMKNFVNPHKYWLGGPGKITCYTANNVQHGTGNNVLTYPANCVDMPRFDPQSVSASGSNNSPGSPVRISDISGTFDTSFVAKCRRNINTMLDGRVENGQVNVSGRAFGTKTIQINEDGKFEQNVGKTPSGKSEIVVKGIVKSGALDIGVYFVRPGSDRVLCFGKNTAVLN